MEKQIFISFSEDEFKELIKTCVKSVLSEEEQIKDSTIEEPFIKIMEVSKILSVSKETIHKWKKEGRLPYHKIGRRIYFLKSEILQATKKIKNNKNIH